MITIMIKVIIINILSDLDSTLQVNVFALFHWSSWDGGTQHQSHLQNCYDHYEEEDDDHHHDDDDEEEDGDEEAAGWDGGTQDEKEIIKMI